MNEKAIINERKCATPGIQVIARAASILRVLGDHPEGISLGAIAKRVELPRPTVQRIVAALKTEGLAMALDQQGGVKLGPEMFRLTYKTQFDMISTVRPQLEKLSKAVGESVAFCTLDDDKVIVLDTIVADHQLRVEFAPELVHVPLYTTAAGKALLLTMSDEEIRRLLPETVPTLCDEHRSLATLIDELHGMRAGGVASCCEEYRPGVCGFGTPVETFRGTYSIAVVMPTARKPVECELFRRALAEAREAIEAKVGRPVPAV
jgi:DNA-binding IclR family transcriptional regulator